jgi:deoxyadenosine/deoxycytidine kinase
MTIEKDQLDFLNNPKDFASIVDRIDRTLFGLFPER